MRKWLNLILVILGTGVASASGGLLGQGPGPGLGDDVVFFSGRSGNAEIYRMTGDPRFPLRITDHPASDMDPAISADGGDIIFTSNRTGNNEIFLVGRHGGAAINLTNSPANDGWARWSPSGRQIVFHSNRDGGDFEIYVMDWDGNAPTRLTEHAGIDQFPDWSPDGRQIAFRRNTDIYVMHLESRDTRRLTNAAPLNQMPAWSPDGKALAFMSARDGYPSVFVMNADGSDQRNLTPKDPGDLASDWVSRAPSWSRNGRQIYFMSSRPSTGLDTELFMIDRDGSHLTRLTSSVGVDGSPRGR
jgi:Tol biopolymer transport system component